MTEADLVLVIGRKLDYQLGYGSPAVFPDARFVRIADTAASWSTTAAATRSCWRRRRWRSTPSSRPPATASPSVDRDWAEGMRRRQRERRTAAARAAKPALGSDGKIHPARDLRRDHGTWPTPTTSPSPTAATC